MNDRLVAILRARFDQRRTLRDIAAEHGISTERVRQLLWQYERRQRSLPVVPWHLQPIGVGVLRCPKPRAVDGPKSLYRSGMGWNARAS